MDGLVSVFAGGEKPRERWRVGTEHEKTVFRLRDHGAPSYEEANGIGALLKRFEGFGWRAVEEKGVTIALSGPDGGVSLEPAGQFELSGAPLGDLNETVAETARHMAQCREAGGELGLGFLGLGFHPVAARSELPVMPKGRYDIMRRHMPRVGSLGLDMMLRTCTVQANLDYASEADMAAKFRVSLALQPLATALFANSPFTEGKPNGFLSYRSHIWTDTDGARTGMLPFVFEDGFGYERYAEYMLDVPMYFVVRDGAYIDCAGASFRDFLAGRLPQLPGERPTMGDWKDHLSTAFPEVRLKSFLEMRGADNGSEAMVNALPALWVGLLYDEAALAAAGALVRGWSVEAQQAMRDEVPARALGAALPGGGTLRDLAPDVLAIARDGLRARGLGEEALLAPLDAIAADGVTQAERWLAAYHGEWGGDVRRVFEAARVA
jgi:glutamate--cysteine ligase